MGERTRYTPGTFCWADLLVADPDAAQSFFHALFGWHAESTPSGDHWMFTLGGKNVAGLEAAVGRPAAWLSYVSVEDADAAARRAREAGAAMAAEPHDVGRPEMNVGRRGVLDDPQGAAFGLWQPGVHIGATLVNSAGAMVWNQLETTDVEAAQHFYADLFGWTWEPLQGSAVPYARARNRGRRLTAGVMPLPAEDMAPRWQPSFTVADAAAACARVHELGGHVLVGPTDTPMGRIAVVADPQGARFGFFDGEPEP